MSALDLRSNVSNGSVFPPTNGSENGTYPDMSGEDLNHQIYATLVPLIWGILTVIGAFGNAVVIFTLIRNGDRNATNYFVINLAISDFAFVVIVVPFTATLYALPSWVFGSGMCKITMYMIYVTLHATCLTLMAMTIDRYCAIVYAVQSRSWRTTTKSVFVCVIVWLVSFVISLPFAIVFDTKTYEVTGNVVCEDFWPEPYEVVYSKVSIVVVVFTTYVVPLTVIIFCYAMILKTLWRNKMMSRPRQPNGITSKKTKLQEKRRKRVTKLVASVVIVFATFWLPIHIINLWLKFDINFPKTEMMFNFKIFAHTLSYANSCVNPFVYAYLSDGFRKAFRKSFPSVVNNYKICGGPSEECSTAVGLTEQITTETRTTLHEERKLMQTDL